MRRLFLLVAVCVLATPRPAEATDVVALTGPGGQNTGYLTPLILIEAGSNLLYVNGDAALHDVRSDDDGPVDNAWCTRYGDLDPLTGEVLSCPLFSSRLVGVGGRSMTEGVPLLEIGSYPFHCSIHPGMRGTLNVI